MIPFKYNTRNLRVRWVTTLLTIAGTGMVVWSSCLLFSLVEGLQRQHELSGDPLDLIVLRKGSSNETTGGFDKKVADLIATVNGIMRDESGMPLVASEVLNIPVTERKDGSRTNIIVRGVSAASPKLRRGFTVVQGRYFEPGKEECVVPVGLSKRFRNCSLGDVLKVGEKESYRVVGLFTAGGTAAESEVWVDINDLSRAINRVGTVSSVQLRAASAAELDTIKHSLENDTQFKLAPMHEADYFETQARSSQFLKVAGAVIAVLLTIGAMFAAANTMFAAVSSRTREIGTMRALGFSQLDILISFLGESVLLCALGGCLGVLLVLPLRAVTFGFTNFNSFADQSVSFQFGPLVMSVAVLMTLAMGVFGGLFPAIRAVRLDVIRALREL